MKKRFKSLLLVAILVFTTLPAWSQASTQGKEFWVSSSIVCSPSNGKGIDPYLAVSAEKACTVTITGGVGNVINITKQVDAGSWTEFNNSNGLTADKWYPINTKEPATVCNLAGQKNMYGLHITATENISVYVILRGESSMDASNILPLTALGSEYYVQDFKPEAHNDKSWSTNEGNMVTVTTILGTEDGTLVDITPEGTTFDGNVSGTTYTISLNQGQTYYLISQKEKQLAGTHIVAQNNRKIAIYTGSPLTRLPNGVSARDALFEQPMPVEYWGTQFIVTRSLGKNGNIIGITASNNGTEIKLDGYSQTPAIIINEGETYYIALQNAGDPQANKPGTSHVDKTVTGDVLYIETSCPCQVYNYDTGNGYVGKVKDTSGATINELVGGQSGDPSSVWVSPIQQKINKITFGACYTNLTKAHFLNVITETANCTNTKLSALTYNDILKQIIKIDKSSLLTWQPVPGNPTYSYARAQIGDDAETYKVFSLENARGIIATVYGNGNDESYAYSAGSAAVEQGINIDGISFTDGYIYDEKFCFGSEMTFDAKVGTDEITRVDWNFGDGTTQYNGEVATTHKYTSPGWYDVTAELYGHQVCTNESEMHLGSVTCSFLVYRPDTLVGDVKVDTCISLETYNTNPTYYDNLIANGAIDTVPQENCYDDVVLRMVTYRRETEEYKDTLRGWDYVIGYNGRGYTSPTDVVDETVNEYGCSHYIRYYVDVIHCLDMTISGDGQSICPGDSIMTLYYSKSKGEILNEEGRFVVPGLIDEKVTIANGVNDQVSNGKIELPTQKLKTPGQYTGKLIVEDANCGTKEFNLHFTVNYPSDIFLFKFNNVLAVYQNKGYDFTAYQWYRNGEPVKGATSSILYLGEGISFNEGDIVYVVLTDKSGMVLPSCAQIIEKLPPLEDNTNNAPAQKVLINNKFRIIKGDMTFDIYGQRVQ